MGAPYMWLCAKTKLRLIDNNKDTYRGWLSEIGGKIKKYLTTNSVTFGSKYASVTYLK